MTNLMKKEFLLAMHPITPIMMLLSAMVMIPNYPYYVISFYISLAIFFTCLLGRENNDVIYSLTLPVAKKDVVKARFWFVIIIEITQLILTVPFAILRQNVIAEGNAAGMDANIAFFGLSLVMYAVFNKVFFGIYYKKVDKVGKAFAWSSVWVFVYIAVAEACCHAVPFVKNYLDTPDTMYVSYKLIVLAAGAVIYALVTFRAYKKAVKDFGKQDL